MPKIFFQFLSISFFSFLSAYPTILCFEPCAILQLQPLSPIVENHQRPVAHLPQSRLLLINQSVTISRGDRRMKDGLSLESVEEVAPIPSAEERLEKMERKARVDAAWEQMNKGTTIKTPKSLSIKSSTNVNKSSQKTSPSWMLYLGLATNKTGNGSLGQFGPQKGPSVTQNGTSDEAKKLAAAALSNVKEAAAAATGRGKVEITEVRDFAGEEIEVKKLVDSDSKEASEKAKASAVDAILEQIKKKPKLSVLDKTKKDWGEFKEENKGVEEELDAYKKSSNQYLEKVSFLQRTDYREFERERDARLALQARRRPDMQEEP